MRTSAGVLYFASKCDWRSRSLEKNLLRLPSWGRRSDWAVSYGTDQLLTPNFSGGSTLNGTLRGDRWARVLFEQIGWLSEPLYRVDADCSGCTNLKMQTHGKHEKIPPRRKHTTKPTSAQRPRPPQEGARKTTSHALAHTCLLYTSPSPRDLSTSRMPSSA